MNIENNYPLIYKSILNSMPYGVIVANPQGEFIFWNDVSYKLFKQELVNSRQDEWISKWGIFQVDGITPFEKDDVPLSRALRGEIAENVKLFLKHGGESPKFVKVNAFPIYNEDGTVKAGVVIVEDITKEQLFYDSVIDKISELEIDIKYLLSHN